LLSRSSGYSSGNWSTHYYYHADGNGNVSTWWTAARLWRASIATIRSGTDFGQWRSGRRQHIPLSSKEIHDNSGFYYYLYRWYEPNIQRWLNRDLIAERGGLISTPM